jgi:hypothetical protein
VTTEKNSKAAGAVVDESTVPVQPGPVDEQQLAAAEAIAAALDPALVSRLAAQARAQGVQLLGHGGVLQQLTKRFLEAALEAEMDEHLGYDKHVPDAGPVFLAAFAVHVPAGGTAVVSGVFATTARKRPGRHPRAGRVYLFAIVVVFLTATVMAAARWREDWHLFLNRHRRVRARRVRVVGTAAPPAPVDDLARLRDGRLVRRPVHRLLHRQCLPSCR